MLYRVIITMSAMRMALLKSAQAHPALRDALQLHQAKLCARAAPRHLAPPEQAGFCQARTVRRARSPGFPGRASSPDRHAQAAGCPAKRRARLDGYYPLQNARKAHQYNAVHREKAFSPEPKYR